MLEQINSDASLRDIYHLISPRNRMTLTATQRQRTKDPDLQINYKQTFNKIWKTLACCNLHSGKCFLMPFLGPPTENKPVLTVMTPKLLTIYSGTVQKLYSSMFTLVLSGQSGLVTEFTCFPPWTSSIWAPPLGISLLWN
jgi:hypothetical protein